MPRTTITATDATGRYRLETSGGHLADVYEVATGRLVDAIQVAERYPHTIVPSGPQLLAIADRYAEVNR